MIIIVSTLIAIIILCTIFEVYKNREIAEAKEQEEALAEAKQERANKRTGETNMGADAERRLISDNAPDTDRPLVDKTPSFNLNYSD